MRHNSEPGPTQSEIPSFYVWIFLDDSGDSGHKFDAGSNRFVVISACVFKTREDIAHAQELIQQSRIHVAPDGREFTLKREYKYSKAKDVHKERFFESVKPAQFAVRTMLVDKQNLYSQKLIAEPKSLKGYMIRQLMTSHFGTIQDAKLVIDGQDTRAFDMADQQYFFRMVNGEAPGTLREVEWADSKENELIQLADMIAGATRKMIEDKCPKARSHNETYVQRTWRANGGTFWHFTK